MHTGWVPVVFSLHCAPILRLGLVTPKFALLCLLHVLSPMHPPFPTEIPLRPLQIQIKSKIQNPNRGPGLTPLPFLP
ncbi:hypothetical protein P154DRAFT_327410 [Amniculicola lignicola CBS 123094]|uniref:Uncharacterized protein n=1 Tax=Amniculicola lignicola CBS 123094 TaxID=1392246 RepID=A0A6A5W4H0_9PLEO|nr:hypothetical protein P154DRAFT_327410 [Amniculicola lignicola CBS 123094]